MLWAGVGRKLARPRAITRSGGPGAVLSAFGAAGSHPDDVPHNRRPGGDAVIGTVHEPCDIGAAA